VCNVKCSYYVMVSLCCGTFLLGQETRTVASDRFENVTVLNNMPADHMGKVMNIMSEALGVNCTHCHVGFDFANEDVQNKATARKMIAMTLAINREHFGGSSVVTCMSCHQGSAKPVDAAMSATQLAAISTATSATPVPIKAIDVASRSVQSLSVQEIQKRYQHGLRPESPSGSFVTEKWNAIRKEPNGNQEREVITLVDRTTWEHVTYYDQLAVTERYQNGAVEKLAGDKKIDLKSDEEAHIKIEASLTLGRELNSLFSNWTVANSVMIAERPMQVLQANDGELSHRFYFDDETGLLRRRTASLPTVLGAYVVEVDYDEFQLVNGVKRPLRTVFRMPSVRWESQFKP
jgi:Photosynthetic reaction centre cytochrome C subunit